MRHARLKPDYRDTWHHCCNHAVGSSEDRPFGDAEKEQFVRILHRVADLCTVQGDRQCALVVLGPYRA